MYDTNTVTVPYLRSTYSFHFYYPVIAPQRLRINVYGTQVSEGYPGLHMPKMSKFEVTACFVWSLLEKRPLNFKGAAMRREEQEKYEY